MLWHPLSGIEEASEFNLDLGRLCVGLSRHRRAAVIVGRAGLRSHLEDPPISPEAPWPGERDPIPGGLARALAALRAPGRLGRNGRRLTEVRPPSLERSASTGGTSGSPLVNWHVATQLGEVALRSTVRPIPGRRGRLLSRSASPASRICARTAVRSGSSTCSRVVLPFSSRFSTSIRSAELAGELLVADGVDVELVAGDVLGLGAVGGLEVDDRHLAGVQAADEVDAAVDGDARARRGPGSASRRTGSVDRPRRASSK